MSWSDESWTLEVYWPEPTQYNTTINNYYYGNNYVESEQYDEEWDDEDYDEEYDEDDEEDCEDDDYEVTNRNNNTPAPVVVNNNVRIDSRSYSQTNYGDINVTVNEEKIYEASRSVAPLAAAALKVIDNVLNTDVMDQIDEYLKKTAVAATSAAITGKKEAAAITLIADAIRSLSDRFIG